MKNAHSTWLHVGDKNNVAARYPATSSITILWLSCSRKNSSALPAIQHAAATIAAKVITYSGTDAARSASNQKNNGIATIDPNVPDATGMYPTYPTEARKMMTRRMRGDAIGPHGLAVNLRESTCVRASGFHADMSDSGSGGVTPPPDGGGGGEIGRLPAALGRVLGWLRALDKTRVGLLRRPMPQRDPATVRRDSSPRWRAYCAACGARMRSSPRDRSAGRLHLE